MSRIYPKKISGKANLFLIDKLKNNTKKILLDNRIMNSKKTINNPKISSFLHYNYH